MVTPVATLDDLAGPPWRLLTVASLNRVKNHYLLLHALRQIVDRLAPSPISLDIVGEDTLGGSIQTLARNLGLDPYVTFHGALANETLVSLYQRAHTVVVSSRHEAASVVALEAAATGVPVVGMPTGYLADWAPHAAQTASGPTAQDLADAIIDLLHDPPRRAAIASAALEWALSHDADWTASRFGQLYEQLLRPRA
jgi:glycosyltransferase involved in cell wall biosynthesis